ncbi:proton-conducting transporter membrane subunit [Streptomyces acidiscabies]|uniref:Proton-conducting transporter membrane subunit n=1 Tax=Streptomyces acidiscabies TaxID=42234 RepID=A0AAP6BM29_9ACTN|nr:proton-conducting transporter membrane subunit [Streptomyces acidiscabies]MBP5942177.1 hydrogenase 4 subunit B [Streptomyces sp. LBUM 1476]MBZ3913690.1 hydrogenase 4 subunit B [Streptomyces acidiscabies]MDX2967185.1 proton-conducting transporter membrane subunit [Streptomyces acidiscabies]MDX3025899.1 proton-conducting transporter membrane subunit [Streptomyces acidiscabies]MDX3796823.1 proton-conducting transporter membrane subunit [Streptomyces acidiscabies]
MNAIAAALTTATVLGGAGAVAGCGLPYRVRVPAVGVLTAGVGVAGGTAGVAALAGERWSAEFPGLLPLAGAQVAVDALAGVFMAVAGTVVAAVAVYGVGYASGHGPHGLGSRTAQAALPLFALCLVLVPVAASVSSFLVLWELMALLSLLLVLAEHRQGVAVRQAGVWYAVMTHLGFVLLLAGFGLFAAQAGGESFAALRAGADSVPSAVRGLVFVLTALAFTSKAGLVPLHAWLPRAHPEAPGPVSALMSAAMVNLGVYGLVRTGLDLLGGGPAWWWLGLMAVGGVSAVYGILQAAMASDLKRLLAWSTCENLGLAVIGVGAAGLFASYGDAPLAALALAAGLLHLVNHAGFKALLFCAAGSVARASGLRDLDRLGGLRVRMPWTAGLFAVGALGAVTLPPGNGFAGEWLLLQSLIHGFRVPGVAVAVVLPLAVAVIALSAGIAAAVFVKALGVGFFARPRSQEADASRESPPLMLAGMGLLAAGCAALAVVPGLLGGGLDRAVAAAGLPGGGTLAGGGLQVRLTAVSAALSPLWVVAALTAVLVIATVLPRLYGRRRRTRARLWDCGGGAPTPRMAYTATSFAEPLQRVFDDVLAPEQDVDVTPVRESAYLVERVRFQRRVPDRIEYRLYEPVLRTLDGMGRAARRLAGGSVHLYLGYGFAGLVVLLVALAVGW